LQCTRTIEVAESGSETSSGSGIGRDAMARSCPADLHLRVASQSLPPPMIDVAPSQASTVTAGGGHKGDVLDDVLDVAVAVVLHAAGVGGDPPAPGWTARGSATRPLNVRIEYGQAIRSAITVAGIVGQACSNSRIRGSTGSTNKPRACRRYAGCPSAAIAFCRRMHPPATGFSGGADVTALARQNW